jgi:hypothetical protein
MVKDTSKPKKAKLKRGVDTSKLVENLEKLLNEGRIMLKQPFIDENDYDNWYYNVLFHLKDSFTDPDNEYKRRFVGPASYIYVRQDGVSSVQLDKKFELESDLSEQLSSLAIIIDDIRFRFDKMK